MVDEPGGLSMRRKWIVGGAVALAAVASGATMATSVFGGGSEPRTGVAVVDVKMKDAASPASLRAKKAKKPTVIYLTGTPSTVDSAALGANMDIRLFRCPANARAIEGGIVASDLTIDVQGSYISENRREYHVLIQDEEPLGPFTLASHLTCLKGKSRG
jgi:hypothetical protein